MNWNKNRLVLISLAAAAVLAACAASPTAPPTADQPIAPTAAPSAGPVNDAGPTLEATVEPSPVDEPAVEPAAPAEPDPFPAPVTAQGEILIVSGRVLDVNGAPVEGAAVEFWQTDASGIYDHPGDPDTANRDMGFQFYGTSIADADGSYRFRTILPGQYEPRPRHIHVKVKQDGAELLTTQFYFAEDGTSGGFGGGIENLLLTLEPETTDDGRTINRASFDIVVDTGIGSGYLDRTDSQGEGPYYPLVDVSAYDNDLASLEN